MTDRTIVGAIDDAMNEDPLWNAEKEVARIAGKDVSYKDGGAVGDLIMAIGFKNMHDLRKKKEQLAMLNNDTSLCEVIHNYMRIVGDLGFKKVLEMDVPKTKYGEDGDKFYIFVTEDGLILKFDTYGEHINASSLYYNLVSNDPDRREPETSGSGGSPQPFDNDTGEVQSFKDFKYVSKHTATLDNPICDEWRDYYNSDKWTVATGDFDGREFLRRKVGGLRKGHLLSKWIVKPFMWLLHHADTKCPTCDDSDYRCNCTPKFSFDYDEINKSRIEAADPALAEILENVQDVN